MLSHEGAHKLPIVCYGCGLAGEQFVRYVKYYRSKAIIEFFVDNNTEEGLFCGYQRYYARKEILVGQIILITNTNHENEIARRLDQFGLREKKDYYYMRDFYKLLLDHQMDDLPEVRVFFVDFWKDFDPKIFIEALLNNYRLVVDENKPELIIGSVYGSKARNYDCTKVLFTGENTRPDFNEYDYNIGFDYDEREEYLRWPLYYLYDNSFTKALEKHQNNDFDSYMKRDFCCRVVSHDIGGVREKFFDELSKVVFCASGGRCKNNMPEGKTVENKMLFLEKYKFNLAFENSEHPGYTTEKIVDAWCGGCIPIYWGDPKICEEFNAGSFIQFNEEDSVQDFIEYLLDISNKKTELLKMLNTPILNEITNPIDKIESYFKFIIEKKL